MLCPVIHWSSLRGIPTALHCRYVTTFYVLLWYQRVYLLHQDVTPNAVMKRWFLMSWESWKQNRPGLLMNPPTRTSKTDSFSVVQWGVFIVAFNACTNKPVFKPWNCIMLNLLHPGSHFFFLKDVGGNSLSLNITTSNSSGSLHVAFCWWLNKWDTVWCNTYYAAIMHLWPLPVPSYLADRLECNIFFHLA